MEETINQFNWVELFKILIPAIATIVVAYITGVFTIKAKLKGKRDELLGDAKKDFSHYLSDSNPQGVPSVPEISEHIEARTERELTRFVENNRVRLEILSILKAKIPAEYYYNFAVYYAYIKKDFQLADFFIEKSLEHINDTSQKIPILRWAARISRLNHNEGIASEYLTKLMNLVNSKEFRDEYNSAYTGRLLRSRGFSYFNQFKYELAIADFEKSLQLSDNSKDFKSIYCWCGIAMSKHKLNASQYSENRYSKKEIINAYKNAVGKEPSFSGTTKQLFFEGLENLEQKKKYYFTQFEKDSLWQIIELSQ